MVTPRKRILFLCTHNSARSQMAEGLLRVLSNQTLDVFSAGTVATGVRLEAMAVMREIGIDISEQSSKTLERYLNDPFDLVITVCDSANESCPVFLNAQQRWHWSIDDPLQAKGSEAERISAFRRVRNKLQRKIETDILANKYFY